MPFDTTSCGGWIEYLAEHPLADAFARYLEGDEPLLVSGWSSNDGGLHHLATARRHGAKLVSADADFEDLPDATVIR